MSLPLNHKMSGQASIRSFFTPKSPSYVPPPSSSTTTTTTTKPSPPAQRQPTTIQPQQQQQPSQQPSQPKPTANTPPPRPTPSARPPSLHPQASIVPIEQQHIPALRRVTSLILPINYPDSFYTALSNPETSGAFSRAILWTEPGSAPKVIGGLVCRPEPLPLLSPSGDSPSGLYIQSLVLLSPYRSLGLAAACLEEVVASVTASSYRCETVWAHAWTQNEEGLIWYKKRGFAVAGEIKNYYFKLNPGDALVLQRPIIVDRQPAIEPGMSYGSTRNQTHTVIQPSTTAMAANLPLFGSRNNNNNISQPLPPPPMNGLPRSAPPPVNGTSSRAPPPPPPMSSSKSASEVPPPPTPTSTNQSRPGPPISGTSFQNLRPETEWNDLPADMQTPAPSSGTSSRSSSSVAASRKKRDRAYPAAAFGAK